MNVFDKEAALLRAHGWNEVEIIDHLASIRAQFAAITGATPRALPSNRGGPCHEIADHKIFRLS